ncbi:hypothetical protein [Metapseudomonas otitidis]|uniref:hypothetical protein n=1 Tax=Metapseudomonas otitidis TaxID=319939 RepID=UPI001F2921B7|nr:hypothetical protein [Pseudomonas otitidis]
MTLRAGAAPRHPAATALARRVKPACGGWAIVSLPLVGGRLYFISAPFFSFCAAVLVTGGFFFIYQCRVAGQFVAKQITAFW